jgi:hypothetical protein
VSIHLLFKENTAHTPVVVCTLNVSIVLSNEPEKTMLDGIKVTEVDNVLNRLKGNELPFHQKTHVFGHITWIREPETAIAGDLVTLSPC